MMVYFSSTKKGGTGMGDSGCAAEVVHAAIKELIIEILVAGLDPTRQGMLKKKLTAHGALVIGSEPDLESQGVHRDVDFNFTFYDQVLLSVNVPFYYERSVLFFTKSHKNEDGDVTVERGPIEVVTPVGAMLVWKSTVYHAGGANKSKRHKVNPALQIESCIQCVCFESIE